MTKKPPTSKEAFESLNPENLRETHSKIINALSVLGEATSEEIADYLHLPHEKVWKRLSEIQDKIFRPGNKRPMKSGRNGMTWKLISAPQQRAVQTYAQPQLF